MWFDSLCLWRLQMLFTVAWVLLPVAGFASWTVVKWSKNSISFWPGPPARVTCGSWRRTGPAAPQDGRRAQAPGAIAAVRPESARPLAAAAADFGSPARRRGGAFAAAEATALQWAQGYFES
jgi:hypothetical protein